MVEEIVGESVDIVLGRGWRIVGLVVEVKEGWIKVKGRELFEEDEHEIIVPVHSIKYIRLLKSTSQDTPR
jgi:hypothetical protein